MGEFKSSGEFATTWVGGLGLIQGEEIVRCKDCKEYIELKNHATCGYFGGDYAEVKPDGFCAWGERREQ